MPETGIAETPEEIIEAFEVSEVKTQEARAVTEAPALETEEKLKKKAKTRKKKSAAEAAKSERKSKKKEKKAGGAEVGEIGG